MVPLLFLFLVAPVLLAQQSADPVHHLISWTSDRHEFQVGDVITVLVTEATLATATTSQDGTDKTTRQNDVGIDPPQMGATPMPAMNATVNFDKNASSQQSGDAKRGLNFQGDISVRVVAVDPKTGLVQVKGTKLVDMDKNKQQLNFTGWVRPEDVATDNTVASERVADAQLTYQLSGAIGKTRGGIIGRLISVFWP